MLSCCMSCVIAVYAKHGFLHSLCCRIVKAKHCFISLFAVCSFCLLIAFHTHPVSIAYGTENPAVLGTRASTVGHFVLFCINGALLLLLRLANAFDITQWFATNSMLIRGFQPITSWLATTPTHHVFFSSQFCRTYTKKLKHVYIHSLDVKLYQPCTEYT